MPVSSPDVIELSAADRVESSRLTRAGTTEQRLVTRARIVLLAAAGQPNCLIAETLGVSVDTVRKWRRRWCRDPGRTSLGDAKRSGRPPKFSPVQVAQVKALACQPPEAAAVPLSRWRSEERRVGKECRSRCSPDHYKRKGKNCRACPRSPRRRDSRRRRRRTFPRC